MCFNGNLLLNFIYNCRNVTQRTAFSYNSREGNLISVKIMFSKSTKEVHAGMHVEGAGRVGRQAGGTHRVTATINRKCSAKRLSRFGRH